jgi:polysaccharide export outer membrane protein
MLNDNQSLSALRILSLAEGLDRLAAGQRCKIMRNGTEIPLDLKHMLAGKIPDVPLKADDILFVPASGAKTAAYRTIDTAVGLTGLALYRIP